MLLCQPQSELSRTERAVSVVSFESHEIRAAEESLAAAAVHWDHPVNVARPRAHLRTLSHQRLQCWLACQYWYKAVLPALDSSASHLLPPLAATVVTNAAVSVSFCTQTEKIFQPRWHSDIILWVLNINFVKCPTTVWWQHYNPDIFGSSITLRNREIITRLLCSMLL